VARVSKLSRSHCERTRRVPQVRFVNLGLAVDLFFNRLTLQVDQFESGAHVLTPPSRIGPLNDLNFDAEAR
jgi:hypothetical protein